MEAGKLATLRFCALLFLLPGLCGRILSAVISTHYLDTVPRWPTPDELRMTPRSVHGIVVYLTEQEDRQLTIIERTSTFSLILGLSFGFFYMEKWGSEQNEEPEETVEVADRWNENAKLLWAANQPSEYLHRRKGA